MSAWLITCDISVLVVIVGPWYIARGLSMYGRDISMTPSLVSERSNDWLLHEETVCTHGRKMGSVLEPSLLLKPPDFIIC